MTVHMVNVRIVFVLRVFAVYVCCVCMYACVGMSVLCVCVCACLVITKISVHMERRGYLLSVLY